MKSKKRKTALLILVPLSALLVSVAALSLFQVHRNNVNQAIAESVTAFMQENFDVQRQLFSFEREEDAAAFLWDILPQHLNINIRSIEVSFEQLDDLPLHLIFDGSEPPPRSRGIYINGVRAFGSTTNIFDMLSLFEE